MTKAEIVEKMAKEASITKAAAQTALESFIDSVTKTLKKKDGKVTLVGFGTFQKTRRKARKGDQAEPVQQAHQPAWQIAQATSGDHRQR